MSNSNEQQNHEREVRQEFYSTANGDTYTHVKQTTESVNNNTAQQKANSYSDGYMQGRVSERRHQEDVLVQRDNENAGRGLLVGILLTSLIGLTLGAVWFVNQTNKEATQATPPVIIPTQPRDPSPEASSAPQKETIIERTRDVLVPIPQQQAPSPAPQSQAPSPAPQQNTNTTSNSAPQQPATETTPAQPQDTQNNTETITPPQTQEQPSESEETTSDSSPTSTSTDDTTAAQ